MTKKQKKVLIRIIIAFLLLVVLHFVPVKGWLSLVLYLVPYFVIGYDILKKAFKGILNRQVFDENFLMAVATVGAIILGEYTEGGNRCYAVLPDRRTFSELCCREKQKKHQRTYGYKT